MIQELGLTSLIKHEFIKPAGRQKCIKTGFNQSDKIQLLKATGGQIYTRMGIDQCDKIMKLFIASVTQI